MRYNSYCWSAALLLALGTLGTAITAAAQDVSDLQTPKSPLVLKALGSFVVGGENVAKQAVDVGGAAPGHITVGQMYVEYMIPQGATKVPVVMVHGGGLSGKSFQTTPDGRMGWNEYFVHQDHYARLAKTNCGRRTINRRLRNPSPGPRQRLP